MTRTIRPSSLTTASDCPRRWAAHHLADELAAAGYRLTSQRQTHIGAAVGSGVHAAAAYTMTEKRQTGSLGAESEAIDRAESELLARTGYGADWDAATPDLPTAKKQIARMTKVYRREVAPELRPLLVEQRLAADLGDGWEISGQLDTLSGDPDDVIDDLKTGVRRRANGVQYGAYAMLFRAHGYRVIGLAEDFIARVPMHKVQPHAERTRLPIDEAISEAWELIEATKAATEEFARRAADPAGRPPPLAFRANPSSTLCGPRWCRAWGTDFCKAHKQ